MPLLRGRAKRIANAVITDPERHTVMDARGAVRSIQAADLTMPERELDAIWSPMHLERLARTYWRFLSRCTLGLIRVVYGRTERAVVLLRRPLVLLRFYAPEYEFDAERGMVRWRIRDGLLVARQGREGEGYLEIEIRRCPTDEPGRARLRVEVEVANFYPALASKLTRFVYRQTQSRIHVLVTHGFLRSLARLDLAESAVGRFRNQPPPTLEPRVGAEEPVAPQATAGSEGAAAGRSRAEPENAPW
jgi:hypothetical protein